MAAGSLCDFCEILACWSWVWWGVLLELAETKNNFQPVMQKARVVEPKTQHRFVDSHESSVGELVWWAWLQPFARCIDLKCCKFSTWRWWLPQKNCQYVCVYVGKHVCDIAITAIFVAVGMPIELYGNYRNYTFSMCYKTFIDMVGIIRRLGFQWSLNFYDSM